MRRKAVFITAALVAAVGLRAGEARAQGFSVYEHDACTMGRAGSGVASPCKGGSAVFFNPAGIVTGEKGRWDLTAGVTMIPPRGSFTDSVTGQTTDLVKSTIPVPAFYLTYQLTDRLAIGAGMFAPYGLTTEWPDNFVGRFLSYKATIKSIYIQPTLAFRVHPKVDIGVGVDFVRSAVELHQRVDLSSQVAVPGAMPVTFAMLGIPVGTDFADARIHGNGNATGYHVGIIIRPTENLSLGARYMSGVTINGRGYAGFSAVPTGITLAAGNPFRVPAGTPLDNVVASQFTSGSLVTQTAEATLPMPSQFVAGFSLRVTPALRVMGDVQLTKWSDFKELPLTLGVIGPDTLYEGYRNTTGWRAAVEYALTPKLQVRGGFLTHNAAAPSYTVTPLLPEGARAEGVVGAGYQVTRGIRIDVAYQVITQQDRRGRVTDPPTRGSDAANRGLYKFKANLFGAGVAFAF